MLSMATTQAEFKHTFDQSLDHVQVMTSLEYWGQVWNLGDVCVTATVDQQLNNVIVPMSDSITQRCVPWGEIKPCLIEIACNHPCLINTQRVYNSAYTIPFFKFDHKIYMYVNSQWSLLRWTGESMDKYTLRYLYQPV